MFVHFLVLPSLLSLITNHPIYSSDCQNLVAFRRSTDDNGALMADEMDAMPGSLSSDMLATAMYECITSVYTKNALIIFPPFSTCSLSSLAWKTAWSLSESANLGLTGD